MLRPPRHADIALIAAVAALVAAGCGGEDGSRAPDPVAPTQPTPTTPDEQGDDDEAGDDAAPPTREAQAADRRFARLVAAYAPVSARVNFLVAAETLRADAVASDAGDDVELVRAGVVRVEIGRLERVLLPARAAVLAAAVDSAAQQLVQQSMLEAIDARLRAMAELELALQAVSTDSADSVVEQRFDAWSTSWDASLRAAREATTTMQSARDDLGLAPAPEEAIR